MSFGRVGNILRIDLSNKKSSTEPTSSPLVEIYNLYELFDKPYYLNLGWDANQLYEKLISINKEYHRSQPNIRGIFDCDEMVIEFWNILYEQLIISVIGVDNLRIEGEKFNQFDHSWIVVMYKDSSNKFFILETTNGEIYTVPPEKEEYLKYFEGFFFISSSDFQRAR